MTLLELYTEKALEATALRAQLAELTRMWLRAEADADFWYFEANNAEDARARRAEISSTASIDARAARTDTARQWAERTAEEQRQATLDVAERKAS